MPIFSNTKTYIDLLSEFVREISKSRPDKKLAIILPSFMACDVFKANYIKSCEIENAKIALFLPSILTIDQYIHEILPEKSAGNIMQHEQVLLMTSIVKSYEATEYRAIDAISIARQVLDIYWSLKRNSIAYDEINAWVDEDLAQHWWATADFLNYCFKEYDVVIARFSSNQTALKSPSNMIFIFAGLLEGSPKDLELIEAQTEIEKYIVCLGEEENASSRAMQAWRRDLRSLSVKTSRDHDGRLWLPRDDVSSFPNDNRQTQYLQFHDIFEEVEYLVHRVESKKSTITIITNNSFLKELVGYQLNLRNIPYNSSFGTPYTEFLEVELLLNLAKFKSNNDIVSFVSLLKSRILNENKEIENFINTLNNLGRFYENFEAAINDKTIKSSDKLNEIWQILKSWLEFKATNFAEIFTFQIKIFELLYNKLDLSSYKNSAEKFKSFVSDILVLKTQEYRVDEEEFSEFLNKIFSQKFTKPFNREAEVFILTPDDALLIDAEEIIFADFNHDSYILNADENVWLSNKILKKLDLFNESEQFEKLLYLVTSKLLAANITFTRAKYKDGVLQEKCSILDFIQGLEFIQPQVYEEDSNVLTDSNNIKISKELLPRTLYPTNIEQLILDPYGFMAKKVLGLRKKKDALSIPENSDFGTVVHELIERIETTPGILLEQIIADILSKGGYDSKIQLLWYKPLLSIANHIYDSNENVRMQKGVIYSEIEGGCKIYLKSAEINLKAIADRIEVYPDKVRIIDYKTGMHASKKDVSIGKAPQLIVEAIILEQGGFNVGNIAAKPIELVYIKVNSRTPYLDETVINISYEELLAHKNAMIEFLDYYYCREELSIPPDYITESWKPNYDDYKHFRRGA